MTTYIPNDIQKDLDAARLKRLKSSSKLRVETPDGYFRVLRMWENGFSVASEDAPHLRGFVDLYEGPSQLFQCLIVAADEEAGEMRYEFKRMTAVATSAARDFAAEGEVPAGLIDQTELPA
ncbi:hypothetical protein E4Z66_14665 [Aliishimia ponticola]|uniref:Uncharacterized protein n=1 Tax=Aliishimia ponticola TaxID=2499833 RepID=A0A4S4N7E3_9RHOB|nr:hypothetical protein [Aliishimia ponticola]THH35072.1 hypothetical protein E4Z66_14665 [Aliishimia ponticola]